MEPQKRELSEMPLDVVKILIGKLNWKERCVFRRVSKKMCELVDSEPYTFEKISLIGFEYSGIVELDDQYIRYSRKAYGRTVKVTFNGLKKLEMNGSDFEKLALKDLGTIFKNRRVKCKTLFVNVGNGRWKEEIEYFFQVLMPQIHVESLEMDVCWGESLRPDTQIMTLLPYLKSRILENIHFKSKGIVLNTQLVQLEQWKRAKKLKINILELDDMWKCAHFEEIDVHVALFNAEDIIRFRKIFLSSASFRICRLTGQYQTIPLILELESMKFQLNEQPIPVEITDNSIVFKRI